MAFTCDICGEKTNTVYNGENENGPWMHCPTCAQVVETDKIGDLEEFPEITCRECGITTTEYERVRFQDGSSIWFCSDQDACAERVHAQVNNEE